MSAYVSFVFGSVYVMSRNEFKLLVPFRTTIQPVMSRKDNVLSLRFALLSILHRHVTQLLSLHVNMWLFLL